MARAVLARRRRRRDDARPARGDRGGSRGGRLRNRRDDETKLRRPAANPGRPRRSSPASASAPASRSRLERPRRAAPRSAVARSTRWCTGTLGPRRPARRAPGSATTYNQYAGSPLLRERLGSYLEARRAAQVVLVGEAAGYRGARVSGIPFTSERQLTGAGPAEATATIVHRVLAALGVEDERAALERRADASRQPRPRTGGRRATRSRRPSRSSRDRPRTRRDRRRPARRRRLSTRRTSAIRRTAARRSSRQGLRRAFATIGRRRAPVRRFL